MDGFSLAVLGIDGVRGLVDVVAREVHHGMRDRLKAAAEFVADKERSLSHSAHVARTVNYEINEVGPGVLEAIVGPHKTKGNWAFLAPWLEYGTKSSARHPFTTRPFPFVAPTVDATAEHVMDMVGLIPSLESSGSS